MQFDYSPIILSFKVAFAAIVLVVCLGVPITAFMAKCEFWGKDLLESALTLPLVLPPSVVGFFLLYLFGKNGPLGIFLERYFHFQVVFSLTGAVIAAAVVSFPLMYQSLKAAIESVDKNLEKTARTLGAGELKIFFTVTFPLARNGFIAGLVLAFARSLGEFGATLMIAGNIPGRTQTMPLAIYFASEAGAMQKASVLVLIMTLFSFLVIYGLNFWRRRTGRNDNRGEIQ